jgi:hypothetical protein
MYNNETLNGVTVETLSSNVIQYQFNANFIVRIDINSDRMTLISSNKEKYREVEFSEITNQRGASNIREYVEILTTIGAFRSNSNTSGSGIPIPPSDGKIYGVQDAAYVDITKSIVTVTNDTDVIIPEGGARVNIGLDVEFQGNKQDNAIAFTVIIPIVEHTGLSQTSNTEFFLLRNNIDVGSKPFLVGKNTATFIELIFPVTIGTTLDTWSVEAKATVGSAIVKNTEAQSYVSFIEADNTQSTPAVIANSRFLASRDYFFARAGAFHDYKQDITPFSTNSTIEVLASQLLTNLSPNFKYRVLVYCEFTVDKITRWGELRVKVNGIIRSVTRQEPKEANNVLTHMMFTELDLSGVTAIEVFLLTQQNNTTIKLDLARMSIQPIF